MNARFAPGERVCVRRSESPGHIRTPYYIRGKAGVVEVDPDTPAGWVSSIGVR